MKIARAELDAEPEIRLDDVHERRANMKALVPAREFLKSGHGADGIAFARQEVRACAGKGIIDSLVNAARCLDDFALDEDLLRPVIRASRCGAKNRIAIRPDARAQRPSVTHAGAKSGVDAGLRARALTFART